MRYIDADGHVEECPTTFSDKYLDPAFRSQRPSVIGRDGLAYWLTSNIAFATALFSSYNRWLGDRLSNNERIKWAAIVNLDDVQAAARQVREAKSMGAVAVMVLGTAGDLTFDHPSLLPFFESLAAG